MKVTQVFKLALLCFLAMSLAACNNTSSTTTTVSAAKASTNVVPVSQTQAAPKKQAQNQNLTVSNAKKVNAPAKAVSDLEMNFPYDVTIMDADGNKVNTKDILNNGKPTAILFWLTTCGPCKMKFSAIDKKYGKWKEETDFDMIAISVDWPKNTQRFRDMVAEKNWAWPVYHDFGLEFKKIMPGNLNGLPQEFLFDKNGELVYHKKRYTIGAEDILYNKIKQYAAAE